MKLLSPRQHIWNVAGGFGTLTTTEILVDSPIFSAFIGCCTIMAAEMTNAAKLQRTKEMAEAARVAQAEAISRVKHETFQLPVDHVEVVMGGAARHALLRKSFPTVHPEVVLTGLEALDLLEKIDPTHIPVSFYIDSPPRINTRTSHHTVVRAETTLFRLYSEYITGTREPWVDPDAQVHDTAARFMKIRESAAAELQLELEPTDLDLPEIDLVRATELEAEELVRQHGWLDADCSVISISPARIVQSLVDKSTDHGRLWSNILPALRDYRSIHQTVYEFKTRLQQMQGTDEDTKVPSDKNTRLQASIREQTEAALSLRLPVLLRIATLGITQLRYEEVKKGLDDLFEGMKGSGFSDHVHDMLDLYDPAITGWAAYGNGDGKFHGIPASGLLKYLDKASKGVDGTSETFQQWYDGMKHAFPQLNIPPYDPSKRRQPLGSISPE